MPELDLFSVGGEAGFNEGWVEGDMDVTGSATVGVHANLCHGIDIGADLSAQAEASAHLRLLVMGVSGNVGAQARAGIRGQIKLEPNVFQDFGLICRVEAAAEASAWARLGVALELEMIADLAAQEMDGLALELFLAFLREVQLGGGIMGKVAYAAMAKGWVQAGGTLVNDDDAGFRIGGGFSVGLKGGTGCDYYMKAGLENPRRFFGAATTLVVDAIVAELETELPPGSDIALDLIKLLVPVALRSAYDVGQRSVTQGISQPDQLIKPFIEAFAQELQAYLVDKVAELAVQTIGQLVSESLARLTGRQVSAAERQSVEDAAQALIDALGTNGFDVDDIDEVINLAIVVAEIADPEMVERFAQPITLLWTAVVAGAALRDASRAFVSGELAFLGLGAGVTADIQDLPSVESMPDIVRLEYLAKVPGFTGSTLLFDHTVDYMVAEGVGPALAEHVPGVAELLDQLTQTTGITPGNIATFGIKGVIGGGVSDTVLYTQLKAFVQSTIDDVIRTRVFEPIEANYGGSPEVRLYLDEVARPALALMTGFLFDQLDKFVDEPNLLTTSTTLTTLQSGLSSVLYKIIARNIVVLEQVVAGIVMQQSVAAFAALETEVRADRTATLMQASVDHVDHVLASISDLLPVLPTTTGLSDEQLAALQTFVADMLSMAQELFGPDVFTDERMNRKREATLALLLSIDANIDWADPDLLENVGEMLAACAFIPDEEALNDLMLLLLEMLQHMGGIALQRVPPALAALVLALTQPALTDLDRASAEFTAWLSEQWGAAILAVENLLVSIADAAEQAALWVANLATEIITAIAALADVAFDDVTDDLLSIGRNRLAAASGAAAVTFEGAYIAASSVTGGIINAWVSTLATQDVAEALMDAVVAPLNQVALAAGDPLVVIQNLLTEDHVDTMFNIIESELGLDQGTIDSLTFSVSLDPNEPPLVALRPADFIRAIASAFVDALDMAALINARVNKAYYEAVEAVGNAALPGLETARDQSKADYDGGRGRPSTKVQILSPTSLDLRAGRDWAYGPNVPISVRFRKAGRDWAKAGDQRRVQITVNGKDTVFQQAAWSYDADREALSLDAVLQLTDSDLRAGLNVLEVSLAYDEGKEQRTTVDFLVDPAGPLLNNKVSVAEEASQFDAPGSDHVAAAEEYVAIRWIGDHPVDLTGWRIRDRAKHEYRFKDGTLNSGGVLRLRTGGKPADDTDTDRHWGRKSAVWNNKGDTILVIDDQGALRALHVYEA